MMREDVLVCIVDDDEPVRDSLCRLFGASGINALGFESGEEFLRNVDPDQVGCDIIDMRMRGMTGIEVLKELATRRINLAPIVITGHGNRFTMENAMKAGAVAYFKKPFDEENLLEKVGEAIATSIGWCNLPFDKPDCS